MVSIRNIIVASILLFAGVVSAQQEDVVLKAMKDEMNRNMTSLSLKDHSKPFFIAYGINDYKILTAYATLGAVIHANEVPNRSKSVRILVGDYEFNDESLDNNLFSDPGAGEIELPLEDDYFGIRRSLWVTTDAIYKSAAKKYQKHVEYLKEQKKELKDLPHRTFAKVPVINEVVNNTASQPGEAQWSGYVKEISGLFKSFPEITYSGVFLTSVRGHRYLVNSEGTVVKTPNNITMMYVSAGIQNEKGRFEQDQIMYYALTPEGLPKLGDVMAQAKMMAENLIKNSGAEALTEDYVGPVLFVGESVAGVFQSGLFSMDESLIASNTIRTPNSYTQEFNSTLESKIGKNIVDNVITVTAKPTMESFNGIPLLGTYKIDDEGVRPQHELVLVDKGVLKNLLNDRSLTNPNQTANGFSEGPGVVDVSVSNGVPAALLKEKLIRAAKEEGMEYAIMIKDETSNRMGLVNVYKISLETGEEKFVRSAQIEDLSIRSLKKIGGASKDRQVVHLTERGLTSYIVPQALLLNDVTILPANIPYFEQETYVESPLKKVN
ncbi:MAG TPA: metallopeptidase TldD-related protein [Cyclobacteriaceae bacterium]